MSAGKKVAVTEGMTLAELAEVLRAADAEITISEAGRPGWWCHAAVGSTRWADARGNTLAEAINAALTGAQS